MKILNFGSLNIDYVYKLDHFAGRGETILSDSLNIFPGGKGLNQSIAMGRAGLKVCHGGNIGQDGEFLLELLKKSGVDTGLVSVLDQIRTGNAIIQNDKNGDNCIILYGGANQAVTREQIRRTLADFHEGDWVVLQNEVNELDFIIEEAFEKGMIIVLNPSPMNEQIRKLNLNHIHWLLLNEVEASQLTGVPSDHKEQLADKLEELLPEAGIVLTLGEQGSCCIRKGQRTWQSAYPAKVEDTTAAGDTFTGYFLAGMIQGKTVSESLDLASRAAAIAVSRKGAEPSIPWMTEVQGLLSNM